MDKQDEVQQEVPYFQVSNKIFEVELKSYELLVYIYLCRCGNNGASAFPSYKTISDKCNISRSSAIRAVKELEDRGLILKVVRKIKKDENSSNLYKVMPPDSVTQTPPDVREKSPSVSQILPSVSQTPPSVSQTPNKELLIKNQTIKNKDIKLYGVASAESPPADSVDNSKYIKEVKEYITYYRNQYKKYRSKVHPIITADYNYIHSRIVYAITELGMEFHHWEAIVDQHFITQYKYAIDWNIRHFVSGKIMELRGYEVAY